MDEQEDVNDFDVGRVTKEDRDEVSYIAPLLLS
jgi:hypothetical protein